MNNARPLFHEEHAVCQQRGRRICLSWPLCSNNKPVGSKDIISLKYKESWIFVPLAVYLVRIQPVDSVYLVLRDKPTESGAPCVLIPTTEGTRPIQPRQLCRGGIPVANDFMGIDFWACYYFLVCIRNSCSCLREQSYQPIWVFSSGLS